MPRLRASFVAVLAVAALASLPLAHDDGSDDIRARYTKYEHRIPARDGKRPFTAVYVPKDTSQLRPILLTAHHGTDNLGYGLIDAAEEALEMLGLNLFLLALLDHLAQKGWAVRFTSGKAPEPAAAP